MHLVLPQRKPHRHMVGELPHEEGLAHLGRTYEEVGATVQQVRSRWVSEVDTLCRTARSLITVFSPKLFDFFCGLQIDLLVRICYNIGASFVRRLYRICANRCTRYGRFSFVCHSHSSLSPFNVRATICRVSNKSGGTFSSTVSRCNS